jgi:hypothetical protein
MPSTARSTRSTSKSSATFSDMRSMGAARITFMMRGAASTDVSPARGTGARRSRRSVISTCSYSQVRCPNLCHLIFHSEFVSFSLTLSMRRIRRVRRRVVGGQSLSKAVTSRRNGNVGYSSNHSSDIWISTRILDLSSSLDVIHSVDR